MAMVFGLKETPLKLIISLVVASSPLAACTPIGPETDGPHSSKAPATTKSTATANDALAWDSCMDPVIKPGKPSKEAAKLVAGALTINTPGSTETSVLLNDPATVLISWDGGGPATSRFNDRIGEAIGYSAEGATGVSIVFLTLSTAQNKWARSSSTRASNLSVFRSLSPVEGP